MNEQELNEYYEQHAEDGQPLNTEDVARLLVGGGEDAVNPQPGEQEQISGDNSADSPPARNEEPAGNGTAGAEQDGMHSEAEPAGDGKPGDVEEEPVIMAKDGKNVIPYAKLVEARESVKTLKAENERLMQEMESMKNFAASKPESDEQQSGQSVEADEQPGDDPARAEYEEARAALSGDFPELQDVLDKQEKFLQARFERQLEATLGHRLGDLKRVLAPIQQSEAERQMAAHYAAIEQAHPDAQTIVESDAFAAWVKAQPSFAQEAYQAVLQQGSTGQVIEMFDTYKRATGMDKQKLQQQGKPATVKSEQKTAASPASLTDVPGGEAAKSALTPEGFLALGKATQIHRALDMPLEKLNELAGMV